MNYEKDTAWLIYSCQVIHKCSAVIQTTTTNFSTKMHSIIYVKKMMLAIFDIMLLWILVYCWLRGSAQGAKNKHSWNTSTQAFWNSASKSWLFLSCMRTSPTAAFATQHGHLHVIFPISKDHKSFSLIQMWIEYFGVAWHAVLIHK